MIDFGFFNHDYPYTNFHEMNLDWILRQMIDLRSDMKNFVNQNTIKYADPIQWNITTQYEGNTIVIDPASGSAYLSVQAVPSGVNITNTDYWTEIGNFAAFYESIKESITAADDGDSPTATSTRSAGDLVWLNDILYVVLSDISAGNAYIFEGESANVEETNIETLLKEIKTDYTDQISAEVEARENADNVIMSSIAKMAGLGNQGLGSYQIDMPFVFGNTYSYLTGDSTHTKMQGACYNSTRNSFIIAFLNSDDTECVIVEVMPDMKTVLQRETYSDSLLRHANDITYNPNNQKYYVAGYESGVINMSVIELNGSDLSYIRTITPDPTPSTEAQTIGHICYNPDDDIYYGISNEDIYVYDNLWNLTDTIHFVYADFLTDRAFQDMGIYPIQSTEYHDGKIYMLYSIAGRVYSWGAAVVVYNMDGTIFTSYPVNLPVATSECESISYYDNCFRIIAAGVGVFVTDFYLQTIPTIANGINQAGIEIGNNTDLDDVTAAGNYFVLDPVSVPTVINRPFPKDFALFVIGTGAVMQQIAVKTSGEQCIAIRRCNTSGVWRAWDYYPKMMLTAGGAFTHSGVIVGAVAPNTTDAHLYLEIGQRDVALNAITVSALSIWTNTVNGNIGTLNLTNCDTEVTTNNYTNALMIKLTKKDGTAFATQGGSPIVCIGTITLQC